MIRIQAERRSFVTLSGAGGAVGRMMPEPSGHPLDRLRGGGGPDRFCAWAGRSGRRVIFCVVPVGRTGAGPALPDEGQGLVLAVRRGPSGGRRRVLWGAAWDREDSAVRSALAALSRDGDLELHVHWLAPDSDDAGALLGDLGFPGLEQPAAGWRRTG